MPTPRKAVRIPAAATLRARALTGTGSGTAEAATCPNNGYHYYAYAHSGAGNYGTGAEELTWNTWSFDGHGSAAKPFSDEAVWTMDNDNANDSLEVGFATGYVKETNRASMTNRLQRATATSSISPSQTERFRAAPDRPADVRRHWAADVVSLAIVALATAACQSTSVAQSPHSKPVAATRASAAPTTSTSAGCGAERRFLPTESDLPGFTQYVEYPNMGWPGTSALGHPNIFQLQYVCGEFNGFITNIALTGVYRQENNEQARKVGDTPGRWPITPLSGQIIQQNLHCVLEIYVTLFQFKSPQVAAQYVATGKPIKVLAGLALQYDDREIPVEPLPGALVTTEYEGADIPSDESQITIRAPIGAYVITLDLQGGTDLDWSDVLPYWIKINSLLKPLESGGNR
jgi:hypothetical protein